MKRQVPAYEDERLAVWRAMVEHSPLAMAITVGASHTLRAASRTFLLLTGAPTTSLHGRVVDVLAHSSQASMRLLLDRVFDTGVAEVAADLEVVDPVQGTRFWTYAVWPFYGSDGCAVGLVLQARETTAQVRIQQRDTSPGRDLRAVNEQLLIAGLREQTARDDVEAALRVRDKFLSVASHELRTPLTTLMGYADLLHRRSANGALPEEQRTRMLGLVVRQAHRLSVLMEQLFDVTRIEHGQFVLDHQPLDLGMLVARIVDEFRLSLMATKTSPTLELSPAVEELIVNGDEARLEQVLLNLLSNAVKYSPRGGQVRIGVARQGTEVTIEVADQGIGIPQAAQAHLFDTFYRASNVGLISGFGIGLHVVATIVERHDGHITVESTEGQGSTFRIVLPLHTPTG